MMTDPEPYDSNQSAFACISDTDPIVSTHADTMCIPTTLRFIPNVPLPPIEDKKVIILPTNYDSWKQAIPSHIRITESIHVTLHSKQQGDRTIYNFQHTSASIQSLFDSTPDSITIELPYYITIGHSFSDSSFMNLDTSMGEGDILTNHLLNIPRRQQVPAHTRRRQPASIQSMVESLLTIGFDNLFPDYTQELATLQSMGFTNEQVNYNILTRTLGNVEAAVNILVQEL